MENELITDSNDIRLTPNDDVQQILGKPPSWMLRWGITVVLVSFCFLLAMSYFIKYPDVVVAPMLITTENPPLRVVAQSNGKISDLLIIDEAIVTENQLLAEIENTANREDIFALEDQLNELANLDNYYNFLAIDLLDNLQIGTLQTTFADFQQHRQDLDYFLKNRHAARQRRALRQQIEQLNALNKSLSAQEATLLEVKKVAQKTVDRKQTLVNQNDESDQSLEDAKSTFLQAKRNWQAIQTNRINNALRIEEINTKILGIKQGDSEAVNAKWLLVQEDVQKLQREITDWKKQYLITAPISGKVSMPRQLSVQQFVEAKEEIMTILPEGNSSKGQVLAKAYLPMQGAGKVDLADAVNIRLNGFPYQEFGVVKGQINKIASVPTPETNSYLVEIELANKLKTTYNKDIAFRQEMQGEAHIITKERRVIQRIVDPLLSAINNNSIK